MAFQFSVSSLSKFLKGAHKRCVNGSYPRSDVERDPENPPRYEASILSTNPPWADPEDHLAVDFFARFPNDEAVVAFNFDDEGYPINPIGNTGITGRGELGKWGPNTAADPLVTRWKRDEDGQVVRDANGNPILQVVVVKRRDNGEFALPGGMVDPGEHTSATVKREFREEALNSLVMTPEECEFTKAELEKLFEGALCIYEGYVDDPRNTNNAWMITSCYLVHDATGGAMDKFTLSAGDDAAAVQWIDYSSTNKPKLYASHGQWVEHAYNELCKTVPV